MFCAFTLALIIIIIIIIIIIYRDSQHQTTVYKSYHEKTTDVVADEGGWRISMGQRRRHHERIGETPYSLRYKNS